MTPTNSSMANIVTAIVTPAIISNIPPPRVLLLSPSTKRRLKCSVIFFIILIKSSCITCGSRFVFRNSGLNAGSATDSEVSDSGSIARSPGGCGLTAESDGGSGLTSASIDGSGLTAASAGGNDLTCGCYYIYIYRIDSLCKNI